MFRSPQSSQWKLLRMSSRKRGIFVSMSRVSPEPPQAMQRLSLMMFMLSSARSISALSVAPSAASTVAAAAPMSTAEKPKLAIFSAWVLSSTKAAIVSRPSIARGTEVMFHQH